MRKNKSNIVYSSKKQKPSPFVVDFNTLQKQPVKKSFFFDFFSKFKKNKLKPEIQYSQNLNNLSEKSFLQDLKLFKKLAFWPVFQLFFLVFKSFLKFSHQIGYYFVYFIQKFFYFFSKKHFTKNPSGVKISQNFKFSSKGNFWQSSLKASFCLALFLFFIILPIKLFAYYHILKDTKGRVLGVSEQALSNIKQASESLENLDFKNAQEYFKNAGDNFFFAQKQIKDISAIVAVLSEIAPNKNLKMAQNATLLLQAGKLGSEIGQDLSFLLSGVKSFDVGQVLKNIKEKNKKIQKNTQDLKATINKINPKFLPENYQDKFLEIKKKTDLLLGALSELNVFAKKAEIFLGSQEDKRYLLVFQNNAEMRASGGFIGSYALLDFRNGKITNIEIPSGGSYDTEAGLKKRIIPPRPLRLLKENWYFWDANWWPDWRKSAKKLEWFYEKSDGPTVDGVIAFTPTVMQELLALVGPIDMTEKYGFVLDENNFWQKIQSEVEEDYLKKATSTEQAKPKKIIKDLFDETLKVLPQELNQKKFLSLLSLFEKLLDQKQILLYFNDEELEKEALRYGWGGEMKDSFRDYLMVVNTNIGGKKSDLKIKQDIKHKIKILNNGTIIDTLLITRRHLASQNEKFVGANNVDWLRVYVPKGSTLLEARGFSKIDQSLFKKPDPNWENDLDVLKTEGRATIDIPSGTKIYNENNKTVFANWSLLAPGDKVEILLKYKLPFRLKIKKSSNLKEKFLKFMNPGQKDLYPYSILVQKQPGSYNVNYEYEILKNNKYRLVWSYLGEGLSGKTDLNTDKYHAFIFTSF